MCEKEKCSSVNNIKVLGSIGCDSNEFYVEFILNDIKYKGLLTEDGTIKIQKIKKDCLSSKVTIRRAWCAHRAEVLQFVKDSV